jgi:hypothetical protein
MHRRSCTGGLCPRKQRGHGIGGGEEHGHMMIVVPPGSPPCLGLPLAFENRWLTLLIPCLL